MHKMSLFDIPIYSMPEKEFDRRWRKAKEKLRNQILSAGYPNDIRVERLIKHISFPRDVWRYNQIIGCIRLSITKQDVLFEIWLTNNERYHADSRIKKFLAYNPTLGTHFYVEDKTDEEIKKEIDRFLEKIRKTHIKKRFYVDFSIFNNVINHVNIREIIDSL